MRRPCPPPDRSICMPGSAIDTGRVDYALTADTMPALILTHVKHPYLLKTGKPPARRRYVLLMIKNSL